MKDDDIRSEVREFIRKNFIYSDKKKLGDDESLLRSGAIDSTGVLELIAFLEITFDVTFDDNELTGENFDSINRVTSIVSQKAAVPA